MAELSPSHPDFEECEGYCAAPTLGDDHTHIPTAQAEVRLYLGLYLGLYPCPYPSSHPHRAGRGACGARATGRWGRSS